MIRVKLFKTLLIVIPCLIIAVLCIIALPKRDNFIYDEEGDLEAFDEPTFVTNSEMGFFYKKDQLTTYRQQKKPDKVHNIIMSENIVTTDFTKNEVSVLPDVKNSYTGSKNVVWYDGKVTEYELLQNDIYTLKGGEQVAKEDTFEIILADGILGHSDITPHRIYKGYTYYAAFTEKLESIYFEFETDNEFLSVMLGGLTGNIKYTLYDRNMNTITTGLNNAKESIEIQYKDRAAGKYYLAITGSFKEVLQPFSISLPSDSNEWMWQMVYAGANTEIVGKFDYYGDEDYFVLPKDITDSINKSVVRFTKAAHDINVVIYNADKKIIGQYVYDAAKQESISMYGLTDAYAMSVYSYSGENSGTEYAFVLEHTDITVLDIETYGFELSPGFSEDVDYYTATVQSLAEKKITDVMYSPKEASVAIKVTQQCGLVTYATLGDELQLGVGRNTVEVAITIGEITQNMTIVISDKTYDLSYGWMLEKKENIAKGSKVLILGYEDNKTRIQVCSGKDIGKIVLVPESSVFAGLKETQMPDEYKEKIEALKEKYPNWKFTFVKTGISLEDFANSQLGESSTLHNTGKHATIEQITECVNPANFLDEQNIFMFEKQNYNESAYLEAGVKSIWNDDLYVSYVMDAAKSTGLSPYFIAARAGLETGYGTSKLAAGTVSGYEGYYNFYGINAKDVNPLELGASYAKEQNWNSKRKAIIEGAAWVKNQYIGCLQNTIYFMKFSFIPNYSWHQYMTDIYAPQKDAQNYYKAHKAGGTLNSEIEFIIPVFK